MSRIADRSGHYGEAEALCVISRQHRISGLEARAYIALPEAEFGPPSGCVFVVIEPGAFLFHVTPARTDITSGVPRRRRVVGTTGKASMLHQQIRA